MFDGLGVSVSISNVRLAGYASAPTQIIDLSFSDAVPQALVQYSNAVEAASAKAALEGHAIYDGGYNRVRTESC